MQAGDLRDRIEVKRRVDVKNSKGGIDQSWQPLVAVAAEVRNINGREALIGNVLQGVSTFQIRIRYRSDIQPSDQILWRGRELNVHSAEDPFGTRVETRIIASTEAPQGAAE
jgi:SPP1 family predicted phage head-tail adaptor